MAAKSCSDYIPEDITRDIFSRLPVKSLIRFQSLSIDCAKLFKTPTFISEHLHHSHNNPYLLFTTLLPVHHPQANIPETLIFNLIPSHETKEEIRQVHCPMSSLPIVWVVGSCNGLICMYHGSIILLQEFSIWNPATMEFRRIELPKTQALEWIAGLGFGFSAIANDYKIVMLHKEVEQGVYSLNTGTWRETTVENFSSTHFSAEPAVSAHGALFWMGYSNLQPCLISFDIEKEVFSKIRWPPITFRREQAQLALYKGSVALLHYSHVVNVWVMDEMISTSKSFIWVKLFTVGPFPRSVSHPLEIWRGEILFSKRKESIRGNVLCVCNPNCNELKDLPFRFSGHYFVRFLYAESLVSI